MPACTFSYVITKTTHRRQLERRKQTLNLRRFFFFGVLTDTRTTDFTPISDRKNFWTELECFSLNNRFGIFRLLIFWWVPSEYERKCCQFLFQLTARDFCRYCTERIVQLERFSNCTRAKKKNQSEQNLKVSLSNVRFRPYLVPLCCTSHVSMHFMLAKIFILIHTSFSLQDQ